MPLTGERPALLAGLADHFTRHFGAEPPTRLGLAVSGGGDSRAMLEAAALWAPAAGVALEVACVDHGLRPESGEEAAAVAARAAALGLTAEVLRWEGPAGGNLQAAARAARYRLLADWAARRGLGGVALAHTLDDQAETFLMRLSREAGVDGLAGMAANVTRHGTVFHRPLLTASRAELRAALVEAGHGWVEDPSNDDTRFERVRARRALAALAPLGIGAGTLSEVAAQLSSARAALGLQLADAIGAHVTQEAGDLILAPTLAEEAEETQRRLWAAAFRWIGSSPYPPRRAPLAAAISAAGRGETVTLSGTLVFAAPQGARLTREWKAVAATRARPGEPWDDRWIVTAPETAGAEVRALGQAGLLACGDWRQSGLPRQTLLASPALWRGEELLAAPLAFPGRDADARLSTQFAEWALSD
ncbi:tRNA lysidine(34) synthetase TilS [Pseudoroseicyclus tamaricis]|uniref:tRNA(Ile)-lysidine synthase n=1 Tax=Pseudoroseicyclus tamaricis TaxID=2705421 RepID=A0A6B2JV52_9RHOB|nr:tRNA lysidine(34) synthetase TilS [Pseudoroseicyclus tamaricis]NDV02218.1 tRNA lysidine(34) synthetase TilS [Pseudoroseicyclus tamaricis]